MPSATRRDQRRPRALDLTTVCRAATVKYMASVKEQRLQILLQAAARHADDVLAECRAIQLSPQAAQAFSEALAQPATVNRRLAAALDRPREFRWVD